MTEAETFLLDFHRRQPGCTSQAFATGRSGSSSSSSYDLLAALADNDEVLDLGAGDGHLLGLLRQANTCKRSTGLDFSPDELRLARKASGSQALVRAHAQALPFAAHSFSLVLSHFAFHLMQDPSLVVSEIGRVLKPAGRFATIVGGGPKLGDPFELFLELMLAARTEEHKIPPIGDKTIRSNAGLQALFAANAEFEEGLQIDEHYIDFGGSFDEVWDRAATVYDLIYFSEEEAHALRERFRSELGSRADDYVPCSMAIRRVIATRRPRDPAQAR